MKSGCIGNLNRENIWLTQGYKSTGTNKMPLLLIGNPEISENLQISKSVSSTNTKKVYGWTRSYLSSDIATLSSLKLKNFNTKLVCKELPCSYWITHQAIYCTVGLLETENGKFKIKCLPSYVISLLQTMNQSVIEYWTLTLQEKTVDNLEVVLKIFKHLNLKQCCCLVVDAMDSIEKRLWTELETSWLNWSITIQ